MKKRNLCVLALTAGVCLQTQAQVVEFGGQIQAGNLTAIPWVIGSTMWGTIESGDATATGAVGFDSLSFGGFNPGDFQWTIGNVGALELGLNQSPGPALMGFEVYSNLAGDPVDIEFTYAGDVWATGVVNEVRSEVVNDMAVVGTGVGSVTLTAPGVDDGFYNEVLALSGGSGQLDYTFTSFAPVNAQGLFNSAGSFTVVPEPGEAVLGFSVLAGVVMVVHRIRRRHQGVPVATT